MTAFVAIIKDFMAMIQMVNNMTAFCVVLSLVLFLTVRGLKPILFNMVQIRSKFHEHYRLDRRKFTDPCPNDIIERRGTCGTPPARYITQGKYDWYFNIYLALCFFTFVFAIGRRCLAST